MISVFNEINFPNQIPSRGKRTLEICISPNVWLCSSLGCSRPTIASLSKVPVRIASKPEFSGLSSTIAKIPAYLQESELNLTIARARGYCSSRWSYSWAISVLTLVKKITFITDTNDKTASFLAICLRNLSYNRGVEYSQMISLREQIWNHNLNKLPSLPFMIMMLLL